MGRRRSAAQGPRSGEQAASVLAQRHRPSMGKKDKLLALAKGFRGRAKNVWKVARNRVEKAMQYQYRDRRQKKRDFRSLWIQRVNAAVREHDLSYSQFVHGLDQADIQLNRKILMEPAIHEPKSFEVVVGEAKGAIQVKMPASDGQI